MVLTEKSTLLCCIMALTTGSKLHASGGGGSRSAWQRIQDRTIEGPRENGSHGYIRCDKDGHDAVEGQDVEGDKDDKQVPEEFGCTEEQDHSANATSI